MKFAELFQMIEVFRATRRTRSGLKFPSQAMQRNLSSFVYTDDDFDWIESEPEAIYMSRDVHISLARNDANGYIDHARKTILGIPYFIVLPNANETHMRIA